MNLEFTHDNFEIEILKFNELPGYSKSKKFSLKKNSDYDSIPLHMINGKNSYHPVVLADYGLYLLSVYHNSKDKESLNLLHKLSNKIIGISYHIDSAYYFPYVFDFALHDCQEENMLSPWFSGMAQGEILSFYVRFFELTKDYKYLAIANKIFNSFTKLKGTGNYPWVTCVDKNQNLWIEEYPRDLPCFTLNGMIFGIYGVYDYYRVTKSHEAEKLLKGALTTIKKNIHKYRNVNDISYYCLKHTKYHGKNPKYHDVHIKQLKMLYKISNDNYFNEMVDKFEEDKAFFTQENN